MVKVLRLTQFCGQEVFSSESEPVAVACAGQWLFLANAKRTVEVHCLSAESARSDNASAKDAHCRFSTISDVVQLAYNEKAECVVALEKMKARKGVSRIARVYSNWRSGSLAQPARIRLAGGKRHMQVLQQEQMSQKRAGHESKQLEVVELPVVESTSCISCCSVTGNMVVGGNGVIRLFILCQSTSTWQEFEQFADIQVDLACTRVSICEDYIAAISKDEILVLKISVSGEGDRAVEEHIIIDHKTSIIEDDENLVVCDFTTSLSSTSSFPSQIEVIQLDSMKGQVGHVEKLQEPIEVLGPVSHVTCLPITVKMAKTTVKAYLELFGMNVGSRSGDKKRSVIGSSVIMLYKKFSEMELGGHMHSLQLVPTFQAVSEDVCQTGTKPGLPCPLQPSHFLQELVGMGCFISGAKQGYMYDVLDDTQLLSTYTYTDNTNAAAVGSYFIQAVSHNGLETYTLRNFAHSVHRVRNKQKTLGTRQSMLDPQILFGQVG
jgi:hypothetical protein